MAPIAMLLVLGLIPASHAQSQAEPAAAQRRASPAEAGRTSGEAVGRRAGAGNPSNTATAADAGSRTRGATTIYRAVLPDGTLFVGDQPPASAASLQVRSYPVPQGPQIDAQAEARRQYWQRQAEAFNRRRLERELDRGDDEPRRLRETGRAMAAPPHEPHPERIVVQGPDLVVPGALRPVPFGTVPLAIAPTYGTSPGAARGRSPGFIGSGFQTAR